MNKPIAFLPIVLSPLFVCACTAPTDGVASTGVTTPDAGKDATTPPVDAEPTGCSSDAADGIEIAETDVYGGTPYALGYPPYAVDSCRLVYLAPAAAGGALRLRDLATKDELELAASADEPRRPTIAGGLIAWEATEGGRRVVRVRYGDTTSTIKGAFDHAGEPRATEGGVVLTGWLTPDGDGDTDVFVYVPGEGAATSVATGPGQQRFADISPTHVAFTDFAEDPDGRFDEDGHDLADVVVIDRLTGAAAPRPRGGKQAFPLLGALGSIGYLAWDPEHPEPKFSQYDLLIGDLAASGDTDAIAASITTAAPYVRPTVRGAVVEWVDWAFDSDASLFRRPVDLSEPPAAVPGLSGLELFGPAASSNLTVLAARKPGGAMILHAAAR